MVSLCGQFSVTCFCAAVCAALLFSQSSNIQRRQRDGKKRFSHFEAAGDFVHGGRCDVTAVFSLEPLTNDYFSFICPNTDPTHLSEPARSPQDPHMLPICAALIHYYCGYRIIIAAIALFCAALSWRESAQLFCKRSEFSRRRKIYAEHQRSAFHVRRRAKNCRTKLVSMWILTCS